MSEQLIALEARKTNMLASAEDLYNGALEAHKAPWPGQATPTNPSDLGNDLQLSNIRVGEWQNSGARIGADEALTYFMSWYEKVDLNNVLCAQRIYVDHRFGTHPAVPGASPQLCGLHLDRGICA
jgi:hypothetical protein